MKRIAGIPPLIREYLDVHVFEIEWYDPIVRARKKETEKAGKKGRKRRAWLALHNPDGSLKAQPAQRTVG